MKWGQFMTLRKLLVALAIAAGMAAGPAFADDVLPNTKAPAAPPPPPPSWWSTFAVSGYIESGITFNPDEPSGGLNFGRLFDDKADEPLLNQASIVATRPFDPAAKTVDWGFRLQLMYGSDARYTHYLGECDYCIGNINQFDVVEAWVGVHLPYLASGGIDLKLGQFVTLLGYEVITPGSNPFYSHSYIFNYGLPLKDTGGMAVAHVSPLLDIYAGGVTGENTSVGWNNPAYGDPGDNNSVPAFEGGIGLNLLDGKLTIVADTNIGPENPNTPIGAAGCACNPNSTMRYLNDVNATWKVTDKLTLVGEADYVHDDALGGVNAYGFAGYSLYQYNDWLTLKARAEVFRDDNGFFVSAYPGNFDFVSAEHGYPNNSFFAAPTTYFEITGGVTIAPTLPKDMPYLKGVMFRPEVRYDASLNNTTPFAPIGGVGTKSDMVTFGGDVILQF
jgi:hypothetical protein